MPTGSPRRPSRAPIRVWRVSTQPGYSAPTVTVAAAVPKRGRGSSVLLVPVVSGSGDDAAPQVVGSPFLDAETIGEIEGKSRRVTRHGE